MAENKNINEDEKKEISLDELDNVTGGSLSNAHKRKTSSASSSSKSRA